MIFHGIDTAARLNASQAAKIASEGFSWVGRYLVPESYGKALTAKEAAALRNAGLAVLLCWEIDAGDMRGGAARGALHGQTARQCAQALGVPAGTAIYFAADWDVQEYEMAACVEYMRAAELALGPYQAGVYGGEAVCRRMSAEGYRHLWQCVAWTNEFIPQATAIQYAWQGSTDALAVAARLGFGVDLDQCADMKAAGLWPAKEPEPEKEPWYADTMRWAAKEGICDGTRPEDPATRAEVAQMIRNYNRRFEAEDARSVGGLISD